MKKTALPIYTLLVIGFFACLHADDNMALTACRPEAKEKQAVFVKDSHRRNLIFVHPGNASVYCFYKTGGACRFLNFRGNNSNAAAFVNRQFQ